VEGKENDMQIQSSELWSHYYDKELSSEELDELLENLTGFFLLLDRWNKIIRNSA